MGDPQDNGAEPVPWRTGPAWPQFLRSQAQAILACAYFSVDLLDGTHAYVLTVIEHAVRRIRILGVTLHPTGEWPSQQARNLIMDLGEQAHQVKFMIDRGSNFTAAGRRPPSLTERTSSWSSRAAPGRASRGSAATIPASGRRFR